MTRDLKPYPAYKDSGVPWLGEAPAHWTQLPGRACYREKKVPNTGMQETIVLSLSYGQIVIKPVEKLHGLVPASFETYQIIDPGDIVVRPTDLQNDWNSLRFGLSQHRGIITSAYMCLYTEDMMTREYGHLLLHAYDLKKVFYGLGSGLRQNLDWRDFKYLPCLVPPLPEQVAIVRYLDYVDRRIRRYIRAKQRLIALFNEQKQASVHQAVTRGLDPDVRLRPSGVAWLGDVPEHWEVVRVKFLLREVDERSTTGLETLLSMRMNHGLVPYHDHFSRPSQAATLIGYKIVRPGQVVMNRLQANNGLVFASGVLGLVSPDYAVFDPIADVDLNFLTALFRSPKTKAKFRAESKGLGTGTAGFLRLYTDRFGMIPVALPLRNEQTLIMRQLDERLVGRQQALARVEREIALLREYRTRLIADVVTGKLDVRAAAATLPEEGEEPEPLDDGEALGEGEEIEEGDLDAAGEEADA
ncbi:MAG: restriction endonuclease subunit S [Chloroflexi bacterium]|nr:restriction endonuclease subunit S [Chloroflexota bacterium]